MNIENTEAEQLNNTPSKGAFSFSKEFVKGEAHFGFWGFVKKGIGALDSYFVLRSLSLYEYGVYQLLQSVYAALSDLFHDLFGSVIGNDISRYVGEGREDKAKKLFIEYSIFRLVMSSIPIVGVYIFDGLLSEKFGPEAMSWIRLLSSLFIVDAVLLQCNFLLNIRLEFSALASRPTIQKLVQFSVLAYFYFFSNLGIKQVILAQIVSPIAVILLFLPAIYRSIKPWKSVVAFSEGLLFSAISKYGKWEIPQLILRNISSNSRPWVVKFLLGTEVVGLYGVANTAISLLRDMIPARTLTALLPRKANDRDTMHRLYRIGTKYYILLGIFLSVCGGIGYPILLYLLFPKYIGSTGMFYILLPTVVIFAFTKILNVLLVVMRRQRAVFYYLLINNFSIIGLMFLFVPFTGVLGLALADLVVQTFVAVFKYYRLSRDGFVPKLSPVQIFTFTDDDRKIAGGLISHLRNTVGI